MRGSSVYLKELGSYGDGSPSFAQPHTSAPATIEAAMLETPYITNRGVGDDSERDSHYEIPFFVRPSFVSEDVVLLLQHPQQ